MGFDWVSDVRALFSDMEEHEPGRLAVPSDVLNQTWTRLSFHFPVGSPASFFRSGVVIDCECLYIIKDPLSFMQDYGSALGRSEILRDPYPGMSYIDRNL